MNSVYAEIGWIAAFVGRDFFRILPFLLVSIPVALALKRTGASVLMGGVLTK